MTEVELADGGGVPAWSPPTEITTPAIQRMEMEARAMDTAYRIAKSLSRTSMVPEHFQQNHRVRGGEPLGEVAAFNLAAAILYGAELGLSAVQSAQNIFVVRGKPATYARTMAAQVRRAGYVIEEVEASDQKVVWKGERDGTWSYTEWTIGRAQAAGYTTNQLYTTNPTEMLRAKCIAELCRIKYQDVLLGLAYSVEELQLVEGISVQRVVKKKGGRGTEALLEKAKAAQEEQPAEETREKMDNPQTIGEVIEQMDHAFPKPESSAAPATEEKDPADALTEHDEQAGHYQAGEPLIEFPDQPAFASNDQISEIQVYYRKAKVATKDALGDIATMLMKSQPLKSYNELSADEAAEVIEMLKKG